MKKALLLLTLSAALILSGYAAGKLEQQAQAKQKAVKLATQLEDVYDWSSDEACEFAAAYYGIEN